MPDSFRPTPMAAILASSRLVCSTLELDEVLKQIVVMIRQLSQADMVRVMLVDDHSEYLVSYAADGITEPHPYAARLRIGEGIAGWVAQTGQPLHLVDPASDPRYLGHPELTHGNILALPIRNRDRTLGVLTIAYFTRVELFSPEIVQTVEIFASHAAIAIDNASRVALISVNAQLSAQEQRSRDLSTTLSQLAAACNARIGQDSLLDFILEQLERFVNYDSTGVFLYQDEHYARMLAGRGFQFQEANVVMGPHTTRRQARRAHHKSPRLDVILYIGPGSINWPLRHSPRACYLQDVQLVPGWQNVPDSERTRAWIWVPLLVNGKAIGMLTIDKWTPAAFNEEDIAIAQMFADQVAVAIHNSQLLREAQIRASQLQVLHRLSARLGSIRQIHALFDEVARLLHETFGYYQVLVGILENDQIRLLAAYGLVNDVAQLDDLQQAAIMGGLIGHAVAHAETRLSNTTSSDPLYQIHPLLVDTAAELVVPIKNDDMVLGIIDIRSNRSGEFNQNDVYLCEALAGQTAVALQNIRRYSELRRTQEHLISSERLRALGELSSGVAHDFNNLLASILGHTQLLLGEEQSPTTREGLEIIERASLDGAAIVRRLQHFAQTQRSVPKQAVDLNAIVEEALAITRPRWRDLSQGQGLQISIETHFESSLPILGDAPALRELITNIVLNAIDAMPQGGCLCVRSSQVYADRLPTANQTLVVNPNGTQLCVQVDVSDTGIGIPPENRNRIFDPFFSTKGSNGTGMGLAMAYGIVQRHQGSISVESTPGAGSTFTILLPAQVTAQASSAAPVPDPAGLPNQLRILVAEDDAEVRRVLVQMLRRWGHRVVDAETGTQALTIFAAETFDLICTDLGMPEMSGWELVAHARALNAGIATLLVTGWGEQLDPADARTRGVDYVLPKPFNSAMLREAIATVVGLRLAN